MKDSLRKELNKEYLRTAMKVTNVCIVCNLILCLIKMVGGFAAGSNALVSDGINSAFDVVSGIIVIIGAKMAGKNPDKEHPYGHERFESVAAIILAVILFVTAVFVGHTAIEDLVSGSYKSSEIPGNLSIIAALISMAVKEVMFWYTKSAADRNACRTTISCSKSGTIAYPPPKVNTAILANIRKSESISRHGRAPPGTRRE